VCREIDAIRKMGVEIKTNSPVKDPDELKKKGYNAVFLAVGAQSSMKLNVTGEDAKGVLQGLAFLKDVNLGKKVSVGKKVVVVGGGSVATDVALTALRQGAQEVQLVCLECSHEEMPATQEDIDQALEEGVKIDMSWGPQEILTSGGKVTGLELKRCTTCYDKSGRFSPVYDEKETKKIDVDMVITAIGQRPDLSFLPGGSKIKTTKRGTFDVDTQAYLPMWRNAPVAMPHTVRYHDRSHCRWQKAAITISAACVRKTCCPAKPVLADIEEPAFQFHLRDTTKEERCTISSIPVSARKGNSKEVKTGFKDQETCVKEARRCLTCRCSSIRY
jgi:NADPH-dependent glutamate synthase beta subunit-like oxidoreductase